MPKKATVIPKIQATSTRVTRTKHALRHCVYCGKETKMAIIGEMENANGKVWFKCTRCRHMSLLEPVMKSLMDSAMGEIDISNCITYQPNLIFSVGQFIFHSDLNDAGKVISKAKTSNGGNAIVVSFEKMGKKTLIENLKGDSRFDSF